jgi:putative PIN family toxin of toxin-antitoxin system
VIGAVLDTNVLASGVAGIARPESTPGELLRRWRAKAFVLVVSEPILAELGRTFTNPYFASRLSPTDVDAALARFRTEARIQPMTARVSGVATHPQDDAILATALTAQASYLVTGDRQLLARGAYGGTRLLSPRQFLPVLGSATLP